jgi:hypothetical protein
MFQPSRKKTVAAFLSLALVLSLSTLPFHKANAMIMGGEGNTPINDPGWPSGAAALFNNPARVAWWEGPPFGGGQWTGEFRGDAKTLNAVLAEFAKLTIKTKRLVIHNGQGTSTWLHPEPGKKIDPKLDWTFMVWLPASWERIRKMPADLNPAGPGDAENGPPSQIDVYTGGTINWPDVSVPAGLAIDDQRMEAHGFTPADGVVIEGTVTDLATQKPVSARMRLQLIEPQAKGGYLHKTLAGTVTDAQGRWVLTNAPAGWCRLVIESEGYVSRIAGYDQFDDQPRWRNFTCALARPAAVSGTIVDEFSKPLADVDVSFSNVSAKNAGPRGGRYESIAEYKVKTGVDGRFLFDKLPIGSASIWLRKPGYNRAGLGQDITTPVADLVMSMRKAASLRVKVDFGANARPKEYLVNMEPEGGAAIGRWSGSGQIHEDKTIEFKDAPPGRYTITGNPNPHSPQERTDPVTVELKGGETMDLTVIPKPPLPAPVPDKQYKPQPPPKVTDPF